MNSKAQPALNSASRVMDGTNAIMIYTALVNEDLLLHSPCATDLSSRHCSWRRVADPALNHGDEDEGECGLDANRLPR